MTLDVKYLFGKFIQKIQIPTMKNCDIHPTAKVCQRSNLIDVSMGRYSYMGAANSVRNTKIGAFCSIASYCAIGGGDHPLEFVSTSPVFLKGRNIFGKNFCSLDFEDAAQVQIGNDVWIGEGVFISGGVVIGDGAVVGAHSVVTKNVPPYAIVAGTPARLLRYRFDEKVISRLEKLKWWDWDDEEISRCSNCFADPEALISSQGGM